jgi:hypothetical protein
MTASKFISVAACPTGSLNSKISIYSSDPLSLLKKVETKFALFWKVYKTLEYFFFLRRSSEVTPISILDLVRRAAYVKRSLCPEWMWSKVPPKQTELN